MKLYQYLFLIVALALIAAGAPATTSAAGAKLTTYTDPSGRWSVQYPASLLHVEQLNEDVTIFISKDRHTVAAVDFFAAHVDAYGPDGDGTVLIGRGQATLRQLYGKDVRNTGALKSPGTPWETGLTFATGKGSKGAAVYEQGGRGQGDFSIRGFLYGYKAYDENTALPILKAIRASFKYSAVPDDRDALGRAHDTLMHYFHLLSSGRYAEAVDLYADGYDTLAEWNPDVNGNDYAALFAAACARQLRCLEVRRVAREQTVSPAEFRFVVEFANEDGTLFKRGPCCGATEAQMPTATQFTYTVERRGGEMRVHGLPVYVP